MSVDSVAFIGGGKGEAGISRVWLGPRFRYLGSFTVQPGSRGSASRFLLVLPSALPDGPELHLPPAYTRHLLAYDVVVFVSRGQRMTFSAPLCTFVPYVPLNQSTKMEALMEEVHLMQERDPAAKAIVFSQVRSDATAV